MKYIVKARQGYVKFMNEYGDIEFKKNSKEATVFTEFNLAKYFANKLLDGKVEEIG